jgi:hypothetical protein
LRKLKRLIVFVHLALDPERTSTPILDLFLSTTPDPNRHIRETACRAIIMSRIISEQDWITTTDTRAITEFAGGHVDATRFQWLIRYWGTRIRHRLDNESRQWLDAYVAWFQSGGPRPTYKTAVLEPNDFEAFVSYSWFTSGEYLTIQALHQVNWPESALKAALVASEDFPRWEKPTLDATRQHRPRNKRARQAAEAAERVSHEEWRRAQTKHREDVDQLYCDQVRDLVGNPFRPVIFLPEWRSEAARGLVIGIQQEEAFDRLPILADALQEADCENAAVLSHCRVQRIHTPGCWVLSHILELV